MIFENTPHPALPFVLNISVPNLPDNWHTLIITNRKNLQYCTDVARGTAAHMSRRVAARRPIHVSPALPDSGFKRGSYSCTLLDPSFYKMFPAEHILFFQTDTLLLHDHKVESLGKYRRLEDFYEWAYVGKLDTISGVYNNFH